MRIVNMICNARRRMVFPPRASVMQIPWSFIVRVSEQEVVIVDGRGLSGIEKKQFVTVIAIFLMYSQW
jgi:hypothetical protein